MTVYFQEVPDAVLDDPNSLLVTVSLSGMHYPPAVMDDMSGNEAYARDCIEVINAGAAMPVSAADGDREEVLEQVARLAGAIRAAKTLGMEPVVIERTWLVEWTPARLSRRVGPVYDREAGWHVRDRYIDWLASPAARPYRRRMAVMAGIADPEEGMLRGAELGVAIADMHHMGVRRVVVKGAMDKSFVVAADTADTPGECLKSFEDALDDPYLAYMISGHPNALMVSQFVAMRDEYRMFLADGEPVAGAGCIEELTPYDRTPESGLEKRPAFDIRVKGRRANSIQGGRSGGIAFWPGYAEEAIAFAREVGRAYGPDATMAVDVAAGPDGRLLLVEINDLPNSGLYASDADALMTAWAHRPRTRDTRSWWDACRRIAGGAQGFCVKPNRIRLPSATPLARSPGIARTAKKKTASREGFLSPNRTHWRGSESAQRSSERPTCLQRPRPT